MTVQIKVRGFGSITGVDGRSCNQPAVRTHPAEDCVSSGRKILLRCEYSYASDEVPPIAGGFLAARYFQVGQKYIIFPERGKHKAAFEVEKKK